MKKWFLLLTAILLSCEEGKKYHSHPYLSQSPWPIVHKNPAQQAGTEFPGPELNPSVELFNHLGPGWILFDSEGNIFFGSVNFILQKHEFKKFNKKMELLLSNSLYYTNLTGVLGGIYSFLDHEDCVWTSTDITIHRLCPGKHVFVEDMKFNIAEIKPSGFSQEETILSMIPFYTASGWMDVAFLTIGIRYYREKNLLKVDVPGAKLGVLRIKDRNRAEVYYHVFEGEAIQNAAAIDKRDNLYVITNRKLYKIKFNGEGSFEIKWNFSYEPGPPVEKIECNENESDYACLLLHYLKKVRFFDGSGTTPTLMGENEEYVGFADGERPMKIIVLRTEDGTPVDIEDVFPFPDDPFSQTENTFAYIDGKFIVENNNPEGKGVACYEIEGNYPYAHVKRLWVNNEVFAPNNVPLVSSASNAAYVYELQEKKKWFLTALDLKTGKIKWRKFIGEGMEYNSLYAPLNLNDKREIYTGLIGKILRVKEIK